MVLFENFDERYSRQIPHGRFTRVASPVVSQKVAQSSIMLEHLAATFIVDATAFLDARGTSWTWSNLTTLVLTSQLLTQKATDHDGVNGMLIYAAAAALQMPNLETFIIWNGGEGIAGLFRYQSIRSGGRANIT
jgi:hypothetical protein